MVENMDNFDLQIVEILQKNGRITISELSERVGLSKTPCQARIKKMVDNKTILGFKAIVSHEALDRNHIAFTEVRLNDTREAALKAFNAGVMQIPEIEQCHLIAGKFDYLLKVRTKNITDYRKALGEKISSLPCVANTSTHVVMEAVKE
jgi:Lrp/AsnC family leucine-responsive transcriptional regulator